MPQAETRTPILREDYRPYPYTIEQVELRFDLAADATRITNCMQIRRNELVPENEPLILVGQELILNAIKLDGAELDDSRYIVEGERLLIDKLPQQFSLEVDVTIAPASNTALEGLYMSSGMYCTQCEAEGFRKITYYPDRPDVMSRFTTTIVGCREKQPVLLANGNPTARGELEGGRHFVTWEDPFPKPSYLFALVAGELTCIEDRFTTRSGSDVLIHFYVEERNAEKCGHAIASLKQAMRWDEERFGLEYDLDIYMVVAVDDFNMGAMENKGLNVFNSKYVLAQPETATDADFQAIQGVIGHEYFHNWTGNRVTCRDWFQLSLKEGLTVYRDQEFSADMTSRAVKRIEEVRLLRAAQFPEDSGPLAHPVRPDSYMEINNFYTMTVYHKGAEVVRMQAALLGEHGFRKGMDLYFERHDGQAVTVDDFVAAMADANGADLKQFMRWYGQAGTPKVSVSGSYDADRKTYALTMEQSCPATPGQEQKAPFHIPVAVGLLGQDGAELTLKGAGREETATCVLELKQSRESFCFEGIDEEPVPSLLRDFSAPVILEYPYTTKQRTFLMAHDTDPYNRWEASQQIASEQILAAVGTEGREVLSSGYLDACRALLTDKESDPALRALALTLPGEVYLAEQLEVVDPVAIRRARELARREMAKQLQKEWQQAYDRHAQPGEYSVSAEAVGARSLRNLALAYLVRIGGDEQIETCLQHYRGANNMTDSMAALSSLVSCGHGHAEELLTEFALRWQDDPLVMDKWFTVQAVATEGDVLEKVAVLVNHPAFSLKNPNKVRALIGAFAHSNPAMFHRVDGQGYRFVAEKVIELDKLNPQVAARLASAFTRWRRYDQQRQKLMRRELERIAAVERLSEDVYEIASKSLKG